MTDDRELLARVGEALYGPFWHSELARALSVTYRTIRRWQSGESPVPKGVWRDLEILAQMRLEKLQALLMEV